MQGGTIHAGQSSIFLSRDLPRFLEGEEGETGCRGRGMVWVLNGSGGCREGVLTCTL